MNALERKYLFAGEVAVSSTVATLDARAEFVRLRQLLGSATPEASAEIDHKATLGLVRRWIGLEVDDEPTHP